MVDSNLDSSELVEAYARARAARPGIVVSGEAFVRHVSTLLDATSPRPDVSSLHVADLLVACGCVAGDQRAIAAFEAECIARVPVFLRSMRLAVSTIDEVKQLLRAKLLIPGSDGAPPRIVLYSGRGRLASWVRVAATRTALDLLEREAAHALPVEAPLVGGGNPELDYLRLRYRAEFEKAVRDAVASLPGRQRSLLRMHYVDGLNGEQLGAVYDVNRSTVSRWLAAANADLLERVRSTLSKSVRLTDSEIDSLGHLLVSHLALSAGSLLGRSSPGAGG